MPTISELKNKLKSYGLQTSGKKQVLINRLFNHLKTVSVSVKQTKTKAKQVTKAKTSLNLNTISTNPLAIFYITTYVQKPNSVMAKKWVSDHGLSHTNALNIYKKIKK